MFTNIFIFCISLFLVIRGATIGTKYAEKLAESFSLSKYTIGFIVVAVISILPETFIALNAAIEGIPSFGLGTLFGSNIADLTLVFAVIIIYVGRGMTIESKILKNARIYPFLLLLPLVLGLDGHYSRPEGVALIIAGAAFYYASLKSGMEKAAPSHGHNRPKSYLMLALGLVLLLFGSHYTVTSASTIAADLGVSPLIIAMLVVGLGTTMPELFFALKSIQRKDDSLAAGDILGTVLADATVVVGIIALINPFSFEQRIIYVAGLFMVAASFMLFRFMRSGRTLSRREGLKLIAFWVAFVLVEFLLNK